MRSAVLSRRGLPRRVTIAAVAVVALLGGLLWALLSSAGSGGTSGSGHPGPVGVPGRATDASGLLPGRGAGASGAASGPSGVGTSAAAAVPVLPPRATPEHPQQVSDSAERGYLTEVGAIDPALAQDLPAALAAGRATCSDLAAHKSDDEVIRSTGARFDLGVSSSSDYAKVALLVDAARNHLCPG